MTTPFYEKARNLFLKTQDAQIQKGLLKYPEPFNPHSWSPQELLTHALEEAVDLVHYLVGLKELLDKKDEEIQYLEEQIKRWKNEVHSLMKENPKYNVPIPKYFDADDQE